MNVLIFNGCWSPNIGNAFVNLGIEQIVKKAFPQCNIYYSADVNNSWFFYIASENIENVEHVFNISKYINVDLVVWGGMMLTRECIDSAGDIFLNLSERKIPIIFLGAGADKYDEEEQIYTAAFLKNIELLSIITRDDDTYNMYYQYEFIQNKIAKGIDSAFFVSSIELPQLDISPYDIECFDRISVPDINHESFKIIRTHHDCFGFLPKEYITQENTLISELPYDYLTIYKNVHCTYAERVHACIATLAFGNYAQLYSDTLRASLFGKVLDGDWTELKEKPVKVNCLKLEEQKNKMINTFKNLYFDLSVEDK